MWCGLQVGMFGKYLNNVPNFVPVGFDAWMANGGGDCKWRSSLPRPAS
jgi:hypothetical protein